MTKLEGADDWADVGIDVGMRKLAYGWPAWKQSQEIHITPGKHTRSQELAMLSKWVADRIPPGVRLWIETPYVSNGSARNPTTSLHMAETVSAILTAQPWDVEPQYVAPNTWKAAVVGNGNAPKAEVGLWLSNYDLDLYAACEDDENRVDAMCIGLYGQKRTLGVVLPPGNYRKRRRARAT